MNKILCHICGEPLTKISQSFESNEEHWRCQNKDSYPIPSVFDDAGHCLILVDKKTHKNVLRYSALTMNDYKLYYLDSSIISSETCVQRIHNHKNFKSITFGDKTDPINRFYNIDIEKPLFPQFNCIFDKVKLLLVFS